MPYLLAFHPELFKQRALALEHLELHGLRWLEHFDRVDLCHDTYGLEVCGIHEERDALRILGLLRGLFPAWRHTRHYFKDYGREPGWKVVICRDEERQRWSV